MRPTQLSLVGVVMSAVVGILGSGAVVYAEDEPAIPVDPSATVYFTGRTVAELAGNATLFEATDPRMSGEFTGEIDEVRGMSGEDPMTPCVFRGTARIENAEGFWRGVSRGFAAGGARLHWNEHYWFVGGGAYEGLSAVMSSSVRHDHMGGLLVEGVIFAGSPPPAEPVLDPIPLRLPDQAQARSVLQERQGGSR
jgi:hypothetical protein